MATTTNYGWTTPDDTDLVKDGAAAIRTLGSSIDTTFVADEGDLLVGGTSDIFEALPIGAAGTVLTSDGDTAEWVAPAGGGANWSLLNAGGTALTGAQTITVSGISGKDKIMVLVEEASSASASSIFYVRVNTDTGSNYAQYGAFYQAASTYAPGNLGIRRGSQAGIFIGKQSTNAGSEINGYCLLTGCNSSGVKVFQSTGTGEAAAASGHIGYFQGGYWNDSSSVTSISIFSTVGNFDLGNVYVYTSD
jgi:hypothetical protein